MAAARLVVVVVLVAISATGQDSRAPAAAGADSIAALPLDPAQRAALQAAVTERNYARAQQLLIDAVERSPKSAPLLAFMGNVFFLDGKYQHAAGALQRADAVGGLDERSRFLLALALVALNQRNAARPELEKLARANPGNALYPYWLSRLAYGRTDYGAALQHAERAVQIDPAFVKARDNLGLCYEAAGRRDDAAAAYLEAIRLDRESRQRSPWPSLNLGKLLLQIDRLDEAESYLRESLTIDPRFPQAHFRLGQLLERREKRDDAMRAFEQAAELDPSYAEPHYALARIHRSRGDQRTATQALRRFEQLRKKEKGANGSEEITSPEGPPQYPR